MKKKPGKTKAFFICLLISSFLWVVHALNSVYQYTFKVPVVFKNVPAHKKPLSEIPNSITADIKASGLKIAMIIFNRPFKPLEIDFNNLKTAGRTQNYVLSASGIELRRSFGFETTVKHLTPDTLYFSDKPGFQKSVPVKAPLFIKCVEGYGFEKPQITPAFVSIWGDTAAVRSIDTIYAQPLTLNGVTQNIAELLPLVKPGRGVYLSTSEVQLLVPVARLIEQTVSIPISDVREIAGSQVTIYPPRARVRFTAVQHAFRPEDTVQFRAMINSARMNKRTGKCAVYLGTVPGNVTVMDIEPREAEILIMKK